MPHGFKVFFPLEMHSVVEAMMCELMSECVCENKDTPASVWLFSRPLFKGFIVMHMIHDKTGAALQSKPEMNMIHWCKSRHAINHQSIKMDWIHFTQLLNKFAKLFPTWLLYKHHNYEYYSRGHSLSRAIVVCIHFQWL